MSTDDMKLQNLSELELLIDADAHVRETLDLLLPYVEESHAGAAEIMRQVDEPRVELAQAPNPTPSTIDGEKRYHSLAENGEIGLDGEFVEAGEGIDVNDPGDREQLQHAFGIDHSIINPGKLLLVLPTVSNEEVAVALANAYNNWLLDAFLDESSDALTGTAVVAAKRPDLAAEEIDRVASEEDIVGIQMLASGHIPPLSNRQYEPMFEAAQDNDLPVLFHSAKAGISRGFPTQHRWHQVVVENKVISHPFSHMWNLMKFVYSGLPVRFPNLDFVFQEGGVAWIPYMKWRLDDYYLQFADQVPLLDRLPSEYIDDRFYFSTQPLGHTSRQPSHMGNAIEAAGPESLMYASDIPHGDFDNPEELFDRIRGHFDGSTVNAIMSDTAAQVFDF